MSFFKETKDGLILQIKVTPNAKISQIAGADENVLKIKIAAPAEKGRANLALIQFLAKRFHIPQKDVIILKGESSKTKIILFCGKNLKDIENF